MSFCGTQYDCERNIAFTQLSLTNVCDPQRHLTLYFNALTFSSKTNVPLKKDFHMHRKIFSHPIFSIDMSL